MQPKLSVRLDGSQSTFVIVEKRGRFILKPQNLLHDNLPENEDLTMRLAAAGGIEVPFHGLIRCTDGTLSYVIRRFDRRGRSEKIAVEDFTQLAGKTRDTKYDFSVERMLDLMDRHMTFPLVEKQRLLKLLVFNFLVGNEDGHLKNFSMIVTDGARRLAPAYDLVNTTLALGKTAREEAALPLHGKKRGLARGDFLRYLAAERMGLADRAVERVLAEIIAALPQWYTLVRASFLPQAARDEYCRLLDDRRGRLGL